ncbi:MULTISPECIES: ABC transporter permease [Rhizobium]|uniref:ABC transporter permease subunit n=1 Tax=Rhizobium rhododendri TaxID=2506430 RepID=A0ABY8INN4_9HYPH|nr:MULTISPECIES: ABC transporter permease subunit [Rhizobium]MBO9171035.1 ABC transporter permease subunit [Rhizobium sp. L245/93]MBZ5761802.1 ABC transporter permease subunit [Rhizobium sp. VS19-DR96]MBZ5768004.1 ABC transporter permease subunit [Rhizobium sp. VS19-DR129.2]MBZ5775352.1 ABC transporter permease subunit [Rhizobium sp. VS19-DRK62.2]MBZ5786681.1 ABC transporter permease subunit [Rhizobium sp. VS19-DR121]
MDIQFLADIEKQLLVGLPLTLNLGILSLLGGGCLALFFNLIRVNPIGEAFVSAYVFLFRGTPLLIQIFLIYYGLAHFWVIRHTFLWPFFREPYWCGLLALVLNDAAYTTEIIRGGLRAVPKGLIEAGRVSGMTRLTVTRRIVLPIAFRQALPSYSSEVISMLKSTALVSTITLMEVTGIARALVSETWRAIEIFLCAAVIYLALSLLVTRAADWIERRLSPWQFGAYR